MCVVSLIDMGFDPGGAAFATDAAGCDLSIATASLMEGLLLSGPGAGPCKPVSVTGCAPSAPRSVFNVCIHASSWRY